MEATPVCWSPTEDFVGLVSPADDSLDSSVDPLEAAGKEGVTGELVDEESSKEVFASRDELALTADTGNTKDTTRVISSPVRKYFMPSPCLWFSIIA